MLLAFSVAAITTLLTLAGLGYYLFALWSARAYSHAARQPLPMVETPVSILKPMKGVEPEMYAALASHCRQEYGAEYELIFGVSRLDDPAAALVQELRREFPERSIRLVECPEVLGTNGKVSNLVQMARAARFDTIVINDSDILVSPLYLRRIVSAFGAQTKRPIGMVTALYRGRTEAKATLGARLEALGISTDFMAGVLTARKLEGGLRFGLGATLAFSREALVKVGGLLPLVDYLADDYECGARVHAAGYDVALSTEVVETSIPAYRFGQFLAHQLRWSRTMRDSRKWGYAGLLFTFGLPWACLNLLANGFNLPSIALFVLTLVARVALALSVGVGILGDGQVLRDIWLLPLRDMVALGIWVWSYAGDTVVWRGQRFALKDGKLQALPSA